MKTTMNETHTDPMPILLEMNGKMGEMKGQLGAIQLQLASDKTEHKIVHDALNKRLDELETRVKANTAAREAQEAGVKTLHVSYKVLAAIVAVVVAFWTMLGPAIRQHLGIPA